MNFCANGSRENVFVNLKVDGVIYFFREFLQSPFGVIDEILEVKNEDRGQFFQHRVFPRFHLGLEKEESDLSYYVKKLQNYSPRISTRYRVFATAVFAYLSFGVGVALHMFLHGQPFERVLNGTHFFRLITMKVGRGNEVLIFEHS